MVLAFAIFILYVQNSASKHVKIAANASLGLFFRAVFIGPGLLATMLTSFTVLIVYYLLPHFAKLSINKSHVRYFMFFFPRNILASPWFGGFEF